MTSPGADLGGASATRISFTFIHIIEIKKLKWSYLKSFLMSHAFLAENFVN